MAAPSKDKKKDGGGFDWPSGARVGVFGHSNAGKTVYFTVLNEDCKVARDLQISVTDNATANELLINFKRIWGVGTHAGPGTHVDLREERKFPDLSQRDRVLQLTAIIDRSQKVPVVTYDYPGSAIDISAASDYTDKVADFMANCDGLLFFFDPKVLGSEYQCHTHVASFVSMLEKLAPLEDRLPIPVALVITKADTLPGFSGEEQTVLVGAEEEPVVCQDYETFLERVLTSDRVTRDAAWAGTVRDILVKTKEFIKVVVGRTLDFQIFFVSQTGESPEKVGAEEGRSLYKPPEKVRPVGVRKPMYWLVKAIARNRSLNKMRAFNRWVRLISTGVVIAVSFFYALHFWFFLARVTSLHSATVGDKHESECTVSELNHLSSKYSIYSSNWMVRPLFPAFAIQAHNMARKLDTLETGKSTNLFDDVLKEFGMVIGNEDLWPTPTPTRDGVIHTGRSQLLDNSLNSAVAQTDSGSVPYLRAQRTLELWELFKACIPAMTDPTKLELLHSTIDRYQNTPGVEISSGETQLFIKLLDVKAREEEKKSAATAVVNFPEYVERINGNEDIEYRLDGAVSELEELRKKLVPGSKEYKAIGKYKAAANKFKREATYNYQISYLPDGAHIHVEVTTQAGMPQWTVADEWYKGSTHEITWSPNMVIHVAICLGDNTNCQWGKRATDHTKLDNKYSIFDMDGELLFSSGAKAKFSFSPSLRKGLPKLKD